MHTAAVLLVALLVASTPAWASNDVLCQTYVIQSGDSLWSIAAKHGVQSDDLAAAMSQCVGYTSGAALQVGQKICLPGWVPACDYVIDSGNVATCKAYKIQQGDTMASIASSFGIYMADLQSLNADLTSGVLQVGTFIRLPPWNINTCPDPDSDAVDCRVYVVQQGDFPFGIASVFRVSLADLLVVNPGLLQTTTLQAGQRLRIPPFSASCGNGIIATPPTTGVFSCRAYKVKQGDSLASIALLFETTVASLVQVNPELNDPSLLVPGRIVKIAPYPAECINSILIDPTGSSPAVPAGPTPSPSPISSPSPAVSSPSPTPVVVMPSPSPVVVASPSPSPVVAASPSPAVSPAPITGVKATFTLTGTSPATVSAKATQVAAAVASLLGVPSSWVSVSAAAPSRRRLQAATTAESAAVTITVATQTPAATAAKLQSAVSSGQLASLLTSLGLTLASNSLSVSTYGVSSAVPSSPSPSSPMPSTPASPAPAPAPKDSSSSSNIGAIVGGAVGGAAGVFLLAGFAWFIVKRRRAAAAAAGTQSSNPNGGVTANITTGGGLTVKTRTTRLAEDAGYSSSPRNTVTPRTRVGNMA